MFKTASQMPHDSEIAQATAMGRLAGDEERSAALWTGSSRERVRDEPAARAAPLTGSQLRAARALLQWTAEALALHAQVGVATVRRAERYDGPVRCLASINLAIRQTFEAAGVEFTSEDGLTGVRIRTRLA